MSGIEEAIRIRAYELWEHAGRPEGRSDEFWHAARAELDAIKEEKLDSLGPPIVEPPARHPDRDAGGAHRRTGSR
jgi:hypothetical protein